MLQDASAPPLRGSENSRMTLRSSGLRLLARAGAQDPGVGYDGPSRIAHPGRAGYSSRNVGDQGCLTRTYRLKAHELWAQVNLASCREGAMSCVVKPFLLLPLMLPLMVLRPEHAAAK